MPILAPFEAFTRDAVALRVDEDESRLPVRWLAAAQVAARLADSRVTERNKLVSTWLSQIAADGADGIWSALAVPGIIVRDVHTAYETLLAIGAEATSGGALNLAYSMTVHVRIALLDRGPAALRGRATFQQAQILELMGLVSEAWQTFADAHEDALRGGDRDTERNAASAMQRLPRPPE